MRNDSATPSVADARALLMELGAPERLIRHGFLVLETADALLQQVHGLGVVVDDALFRAGAMLHDAGQPPFAGLAVRRAGAAAKGGGAGAMGPGRARRSG